jgi:hypothetical protein
MTRMLIATTAVALAAAVIGGPANATALMDRPAIVFPVPALAARTQPGVTTRAVRICTAQKNG